MSLRSMTGYGRGEAQSDYGKVVAELSSLNRRQLEFLLSVPRELLAYEAKLHLILRESIVRGAVKGTLQLIRGGGEGLGVFTIDGERARCQVGKLRRVAEDLGLPDDLGMSALLRLPGVVDTQIPESDPAALECLVVTAFKEALDNLVAMRKREGAELARDLKERRHGLETLLQDISRRSENWPQEFKQRLEQRLRQLGEIEIEPAVLAHELIFYVDRADISEELTRISSHLKQVAQLLEGNATVGRELDFLCQELLREINTVGSKANDTELSALVIAFKSQLESMREQMQNIE